MKACPSTLASLLTGLGKEHQDTVKSESLLENQLHRLEKFSRAAPSWLVGKPQGDCQSLQGGQSWGQDVTHLPQPCRLLVFLACSRGLQPLRHCAGLFALTGWINFSFHCSSIYSLTFQTMKGMFKKKKKKESWSLTMKRQSDEFSYFVAELKSQQGLCSTALLLNHLISPDCEGVQLKPWNIFTCGSGNLKWLGAIRRTRTKTRVTHSLTLTCTVWKLPVAAHYFFILHTEENPTYPPTISMVKPHFQSTAESWAMNASPTIFSYIYIKATTTALNFS